ncbi:hypothetical protein TNCV_4583721 [Trichonephila clavipes]|nr:hypothetical protein TNCV_4583721 [Trichonephila clavipes]
MGSHNETFHFIPIPTDASPNNHTAKFYNEALPFTPVSKEASADNYTDEDYKENVVASSSKKSFKNEGGKIDMCTFRSVRKYFIDHAKTIVFA